MAKTGRSTDLKKIIDAAALIALTLIPLISDFLKSRHRPKEVVKEKRHYTKDKSAVLKIHSRNGKKVLPIDTTTAVSNE